MMCPRLALAAAALSLSLAGCDGDSRTDNGQVTVKNRVDDTIVIHYETEVVTAIHDCDCDGETDSIDLGLDHHHTHLPAGDEATLTVDSVGYWDGEITVECAGQFRTYDVDFDFWGFDTVWVREEDFLPAGNG